jgi:hypothetical protein
MPLAQTSEKGDDMDRKSIQDILNKPILQLGETDFLKFRDLIEGGVLITGSLGAGKTSRSNPAATLANRRQRGRREKKIPSGIEARRTLSRQTQNE